MDTLTKVKAILQSIRSRNAARLAKLRELSPQKHTPQHIADERQRLKDEDMKWARQQLVQSSIEAELATELAAQRAASDRRAVIAAQRFTPAVDPTVVGGLMYERVMVRMQAEMNERSAETLWLLKAPELTAADLARHFETALTRREYAVVNVTLREMEARAERSTTGTDADLAAGMEIRRQARAMQAQLEAHDMPTVAATEAAAAELQAAQSWLAETVASIETGDDAGIRQQTLFELRQRGATNDEINAAMSALRNAA